MTFRILNEVKPATERLRVEFPECEVVDLEQLSDEAIAAVRGDVLFGGWSARAATIVANGVPWVQLSGTGIDGIDAAVLAAPTVTCARGASAVPISEYVIAALLNHAKGLPEHWLDAPPKHWNFQRMHVLEGSVLGIVGLGGIGERVARLGLAFGMRVLALRRHPELGSPIDGCEVVGSLDAMLPLIDHLVLAAPATNATHHLIDATTLRLVKPGLHIVNIARGALIDQDALRVALDDGRVARASLDTMTPEPLPAGHWLYDHDRVFLTPHSSWSSAQLFTAAIEVFCENVHRRLRGDALLHVVDRDAGY